MTDAEVFAGSSVMGAVAGMRSMSAPAIVSQLARAGVLPVNHSPLSFLNWPTASKAMTVFAIGEAIFDKMPFAPKRTKAPSMAARAVSGALAGAAICSAKKRPLFIGICLGAAGAVAGTYAGYHLRRWVGETFNISDRVVAMAEDAAVAGIGMLALSKLRPPRAA